MSIKYIIAQIRHEKNMTQKQLAKKAGISTAMISFIENDKRQPTFYVIALIAKALDVTVDYCEPHTCDFNHELGEQNSQRI